MKNGMSLQDLLTEVARQQPLKRDFIASTKESMRMVQMDEMPDGVALVLLQEGQNELQRFSISDNCHRQIAARLQIPWKYYSRLLSDHKDLVINQVNALFEREPSLRLMRTMDGVARAFLSNRFGIFDNGPVLENVLPPIVKGDIQSKLLSSYVGPNSMKLKVLFTDPRLAIDMGEAPNGGRRLPADRPGHVWTGRNDTGRDIIHPGAIISNSETGHGSLDISGFFWRSYCDNGCVFGMMEAFNFSRRHVGGKLIEGVDFEVFSDETKRKQQEVVFAEVTDTLRTLSSPEKAQAMAAKLRATKDGEQVKDAFAAVDVLAKELPILDGEKQGILESLIRDGDYTRWGMLNAVTEQANRDDISYERACEFEEFGAKLIDLTNAQWKRIALAEKVAA
jgi:hypothetical protein